MNKYDLLKKEIQDNPKVWLITGVAGFIGSNLLEELLQLNQRVVGLDNFLTGYQHNLDDVKTLVSSKQWENFQFIKGDIRNFSDCVTACQDVDFVLHQAALGSVPRSIDDPILTNQNNIDGFLNMLVAAKNANVERFVYAASSSTYGDHSDLPKIEHKIGRPLSPYAVTKVVNELYADVFAKTYGFKTVGLRYFNIFGKRQNPDGAYAAVIPRWIASMINGDTIYINGNGETSRDFCYIENAVQANILAASSKNNEAVDQVYNIAVGGQTSLNQLFEKIKYNLKSRSIECICEAVYQDFRAGDVMHSLADISKSERLLNYEPSHDIDDGLIETIDWYIEKSSV